jgi:phage/plasmid-associated DNA primase
MITEAPVKKNKEIKTFDIVNVKDWIDKQLEFNPSAETYLKQCYEGYKKYLEIKKKVVPLSKKSFSRLFKDSLKEREDQGQIRFYQRSSILIRGVKLKNLKIGEESFDFKIK